MKNIAIFRSRNQCLRFSETLRMHRIQNAVINTPREAGVGCGISVEIEADDYYAARSFLTPQSFNAFDGWMETYYIGYKKIVRRL